MNNSGTAFHETGAKQIGAWVVWWMEAAGSLLAERKVTGEKGAGDEAPSHSWTRVCTSVWTRE